jgi:uncharacterized membrane protein
MFIVTVLFVLAGCLFIGISIPLIQKRVKPNPWYGFRVPKTLSNPDIWYAANAYMARRMILVGLLTVVAALVFTPLGWIPGQGLELYVVACQTVLIGGLVWTVIASFRYLRRL